MSGATQTEMMAARNQAVARLRQELRRRWRPGDRLPPIKTLAQLLGAGQTNMHRAAKMLADEGVLIASSKRGTFVRMLPDDPTATKRALLLRLPLNDTDTFLTPAVTAMTDRLRRNAIDVHTEFVNIRCELRDPSVIEKFDALISLQPMARVLMANDPRRPGVVITTSEEEPMAVGEGYDVISVDSVQGGMLAGNWVRRINSREAAFVGVAEDRARTRMDEVSRKRLSGFERGLGREVREEYRIVTGAYRAAHGEEGFERYRQLPRRPRSVFCASDDLAVGFVAAGLRRGLRPGRDFHVVGFDGQSRGQQLPCGALTTVRVPVEQLGTVAADLLLSRFNQPDLPVRRVLLACDFIPGQTAIPRNN